MRHHLILRVVTKMLVGTIILFAFYVQFHGDFSPGGGFQAGVIMAVAFIIYGVVFGLDEVQQVFPAWIVHKLLALGVLIYAGTGFVSLFWGTAFSIMARSRRRILYTVSTMGFSRSNLASALQLLV